MISQQVSQGGDEQLLDQAIAEFLRAEAAGQVCDRQQWLDRYPACAESLAEFFDDREHVDLLIAPVRVGSDAAGPGNGSTDRFTRPVHDDASSGCVTIDLCPEPPLLSSTRYRPLSFHARGGMGEIWLAKDEQIGRNVAVKKLRRGREAQQARFLIEAQITGQLEHPSVVPLHDLGLDDDGNPFYVMKFIRGRRLKDAITDFHAKRTKADWTNDLEFRRLLETFVNVCNVVAFAHDKGVLHRDIKPDNVMLGSYGETIVLDWGLAKVVGEPEHGPDAAVEISGSGSTATQRGAVIGSPFYMSPEVAEGLPEAIDQSSDVYLLGATLYEMLCNRPPRQAGSSWELIDLALNSRPTTPRKIDRQIPRALEAICLKALAFDKRDRYQTALALAEDVERYLAGAATNAYQEPLSARIGRWIRRHRRRIAQGLAAVLMIVLAAAAFQGFRQARFMADREQARVQLAEFHRLADEAQFFAANTDLVSERVPYYELRRAASIGKRALEIAAPWGSRAQSLPLSDERSDFLQSQYALLLVMAQSTFQDTRSQAAASEALALLEKAETVQPPTRGYHELRSQCFTLLGDPSAAESELSRANAPKTPVTAHDYFLVGEQLRLQDAGASVVALDDSDFSVHREHLTAAIQKYRQALEADPRHYWARFQLGRCLLGLGRSPEAIEALSACIAMRPSSPWAYSTLGLANMLSNRPDEAIDVLDQAVRLDPEFYPARLNRGVVHWLQNQNDKAISDFSEVLAAPENRRLIEAAFYRGQVLLSEQRDREALIDFSAVVADRPDFRPAYWFRAKTQFRLDNFDAGRSDVDHYLALNRSQPKSNDAAQQHLLKGKTLRNLAQQLEGVTRTRLLHAAANEFQAAIDIGPPSPEMWIQLGDVQKLCGAQADAISAFSQGLAIANGDVELLKARGWAYVDQSTYDSAEADFKAAIRTKPNDPEARTGLGIVLAELGRPADAHREASAALLTGADNHLILHNVACILAQLSTAQSDRKTEFENLAIAALERAVSLSRRHPIGPDADELVLIRNETSFPPSLKSRPEFQRMLSAAAATP